MDLGALALSHLADAAIRALAVAMLALAALTLARVRSVSARHAVWTAVLLSMLSLPLLTPALPPIPVPILRASAPVAPVTLVPAGQAWPRLPSRNFARIVSTPKAAPFPWRKAGLALYLGVLLLMLGRLAVSYVLVRRLVRASSPIRDEWALDYVGRSAGVLESRGIAVPITAGCFKPQVLLPLGWREWSRGKLDAALSHELAHVRRRDSLIALMAGVNKAVFWFHPLAWWLERKLALLAEDACDDASLLVLGDRQRYASVLLEMAAAAHGGRFRLPWEAIPMARPSTLRRRIDRILDESRRISGSVSRGRWMVLSLVSAALLYGAAAVQLQSVPTHVSPRVPASSMPAVALQFASPVQQQGATPAGALSERERRLRDERLRKELESPYRKWLVEDVAYIITPEERDTFKNLSTDDEREEFIEQFWLKRDPTPGTLENECKEEHYRRIAYTNDRFSSSLPGWKTDRGRIYITFGPPDEVESHPAGNQGSPPYEIWRYHWIEGIGTNVQIEFVDTARTGEYRMTMNPAEKSALLMVPKA